MKLIFQYRSTVVLLGLVAFACKSTGFVVHRLHAGNAIFRGRVCHPSIPLVTTRRRDDRGYLNGKETPENDGALRIRPDWAYGWMPSWMFTMRPMLQIATIVSWYVFHLTVLSQRHIVFPVQLFPNKDGYFSSIGLDSIAGIITLVFYSVLRRRQNRYAKQKPGSSNSLTPILSSPINNAPWKLPANSVRHKGTSALTIFLLIRTYFWTGRFSLFWEDTLYSLSGLGVPLTTPMYRSLLVLLGHLSWVVAGTCILRWVPRPPRFFGDKNVHEVGDNVKMKSPYRWFRSNLNSNFVWWVVGGYFVSSWMFNVADTVNQLCLSETALSSCAQESIVTQLVNPENRDVLASMVGYIAPCISAPWWEEILYRGFLLSALTNMIGYRMAALLQAVIFSAHHLSVTGAIPLAVLGWIWAVLYTKSQNLITVVLVHCLWNSRIFLGAWLGL